MQYPSRPDRSARTGRGQLRGQNPSANLCSAAMPDNWPPTATPGPLHPVSSLPLPRDYAAFYASEFAALFLILTAYLHFAHLSPIWIKRFILVYRRMRRLHAWRPRSRPHQTQTVLGISFVNILQIARRTLFESRVYHVASHTISSVV